MQRCWMLVLCKASTTQKKDPASPTLPKKYLQKCHKWGVKIVKILVASYCFTNIIYANSIYIYICVYCICIYIFIYKYIIPYLSIRMPLSPIISSLRYLPTQGTTSSQPPSSWFDERPGACGNDGQKKWIDSGAFIYQAHTCVYMPILHVIYDYIYIICIYLFIYLCMYACLCVYI